MPTIAPTMIDEHHPPVRDEEVGDRDHHQRQRTAGSAPKLANTCLNAGITKTMITHTTTTATTMTDDRVEQRRLDLALDREDLLLVRREPVEDRVERARRSRRPAPGCSTARRSARDARGTPATGCEPVSTLFLMSQHQPREARVAVAARDDVERLQQRHAGLQHRRELAGEERDVLLADRAAAAERLPLDLGDADALAPQVRRRRPSRTRRASRRAPGLLLRSTPSQRNVYSLTLRRCGAAAVAMTFPSVRRARGYSLVTASISSSDVMPALDLEQAGLAQVAHAFALRLLGDVERVAVAHDQLAHLVGDRHHLVDADAALVAGALAVVAADGPNGCQRAVEVLLGEARAQQRLGRDVLGRLALRAQPAREPLRRDQDAPTRRC